MEAIFLNSHTSNPYKALEGSEPDVAKILLAHQPKTVYEAAKYGVDLQLSGHTHGGQFFPGNYFVKIDQPFIAGLYTYKGNQTLCQQRHRILGTTFTIRRPR